MLTKISEFHKNDIVYNHYCYEKMTDSGFLPHTHDGYEIVYLKQGSVKYTVEGKNYELENGDLIFTRSGLRHNILFNDKNIYDRYCILFDKSIFSSKIYDKIPEGLDVIKFKSNSIVDELFKKLDFYNEYLQEMDFGYLLSHLTEEIVYNIMLENVMVINKSSELYTSEPVVINAIEYIKGHINCEIEDICEQFHITKSYLHKLFIKHLGVSPKKYIISKRLQKARRRLRFGKKPTEIFSECGFSDYCTFFRNYKKHFGYPPSEEFGKEVIQKIKS